MITEEEIRSRVAPLRRKRDTKGFKQFRAWVDDNLEDLCEAASTRWLVSIVDTYADYSENGERQAACLVTLFASWEKLALTARLTRLTPEEKPIPKAATELWDGMWAFGTGRSADMVRNLFRRIKKALEAYPVFLAIFRTIVKRMFLHPWSTLSVLDRYCESKVRETIMGELE